MPEKPAVVAVAVAETAAAPVEEKITPVKPFRLGAAREYKFVTKITVKNNGDDTSTGVRLEIPLLTASSLYQVQSGERFSLNPVEIKNVQGTRVGVFNFEDLAPGAEAVLELRYQVRTSVIEFFGDFVPETSGSKPTQYLNATKGIESDSTQIVNLAAQVTGDKLTDWDKATEITRWVAANISYDGAAANRNSGALAALQSKKGVCEDYAALAVALARATGIPARIAYGYTDNGSNWPASGSFALRGFRHAWVEYYLEGRGWVPAEPTRSTSTKLYFGTFPHNRYIVQNYNDISLKGNYRGGKLAISWADSLE
jgi:transglutaminase-like putative cysteine protease